MSPTFTTLIDAPRLRQALAGPDAPIVVDTQFDLANPEAGNAAWREGHVPGSVYLHLDRDLSGAKSGRNGRHPLPAREDFARTLGRAGISPATQVVVVDAQSGMYAARLWWMLRWMGHERVAVLDGGVQAWAAAGGALVRDAAQRPALPPYPATTTTAATVDADTLARTLGAWRLVDARAGERFRGEVEPLDPCAGHIPGASNRCFKDNLDAQGRFKPADLLRREFDALLGHATAERTVHQCGSGVTACHNLLAMEHAGLRGSRLYPGSWSEWCADPGRPVARGG